MNGTDLTLTGSVPTFYYYPQSNFMHVLISTRRVPFEQRQHILIPAQHPLNQQIAPIVPCG